MSTSPDRTMLPPDVCTYEGASTSALLSNGSGSAPRMELVRTAEPYDLSAIALVREFIEHIVSKATSPATADDVSPRDAIDWSALQAATASCGSLEQAIGRGVVVADRMCRDGRSESDMAGAPSPDTNNGPFFSFSVSDMVPDFGDESRYRTRVAKRIGRIFRIRRSPCEDSVAALSDTSES